MECVINCTPHLILAQTSLTNFLALQNKLPTLTPGPRYTHLALRRKMKLRKRLKVHKTSEIVRENAYQHSPRARIGCRYTCSRPGWRGREKEWVFLYQTTSTDDVPASPGHHGHDIYPMIPCACFALPNQTWGSVWRICLNCGMFIGACGELYLDNMFVKNICCYCYNLL